MVAGGHDAVVVGPLVLGSHAIWRELEAQTGETLLLQNGVLIRSSPAGPG